MVRSWAEAGWECVCVDAKHPIRNDKVTSIGKGSIRFTWDDVRSWCPPSGKQIAILFAFPPCTDLAVSGARDFKRKAGYRLSDALEIFDACQLAAAYAGCPYMIENPVGRLSSHRRPPDYTFNPCDYGGYLQPPGDTYTKKTCLWTGGGFVMPEPRPVHPSEGSRIIKLSPGANRQAERAETPMGFAKAAWEANETALVGMMQQCST